MPESLPATSTVTVHVGGAVSSPGVYALPVNSRVIHAVEMAGGLTESADSNLANMAETLKDGDSYIVPEDDTSAQKAGTAIVYLSGSIEQPGLYSLPAGSRVTDAISAAGGIAEQADVSELNLAAIITDGAHYDIQTRNTPNSEPVFVHIVGAIERPGTYTMPHGARLVDVMETAGGPTSGADTDAVDLALRLEDGQRYYVPFQGEQAVGDVTVHIAGAVVGPGLYMLPNGTRLIDAIEAAGGVLSTADVHTLNLAQPIHDGARYAIPTMRTTINVNMAGVGEFEGIQGISRILAQAIVNHRDAVGSFTDIDQLLDVPGIGPTTLAAIRSFISVS